jgi:hypothetical protein
VGFDVDFLANCNLCGDVCAHRATLGPRRPTRGRSKEAAPKQPPPATTAGARRRFATTAPPTAPSRAWELRRAAAPAAAEASTAEAWTLSARSGRLCGAQQTRKAWTRRRRFSWPGSRTAVRPSSGSFWWRTSFWPRRQEELGLRAGGKHTHTRTTPFSQHWLRSEARG